MSTFDIHGGENERDEVEKKKGKRDHKPPGIHVIVFFFSFFFHCCPVLPRFAPFVPIHPGVPGVSFVPKRSSSGVRLDEVFFSKLRISRQNKRENGRRNQNTAKQKSASVKGKIDL